MIIEHFETLDVRKSHCHVCFRAITFFSLAVYLSFQCVVRLLLIYSWPIDTIAWINFEYTYSYRSPFSTKHLLGIDELWSHQLKSRYKHVRNNLDGDFFFWIGAIQYAFFKTSYRPTHDHNTQQQQQQHPYWIVHCFHTDEKDQCFAQWIELNWNEMIASYKSLFRLNFFFRHSLSWSRERERKS